MTMNDVRDAVAHYLALLAGPSADDACRSLLELGHPAVPHLVDAFRAARSANVKLRLAQIIAYSRAAEAGSFLVELLEDPADEMWKTALDGLVTLGTHDTGARRGVLDSLVRASRTANPKKREWIVEAIEQIPPVNRHPLNTRAIQGARVLNYGPDQRWVDWAASLLVEGADTPGLRVLAGLLPPFNAFEVTQLLDRTLDELGAPVLMQEEAPAAYAYPLVAELMQNPESTDEMLEQLSQLCIATDHPSALMPFYLLHHARCDLVVQGHQHYWDGADRSNIDQLVQDEARRWLQTHAV
jgi:hypothetical protein